MSDGAPESDLLDRLDEESRRTAVRDRYARIAEDAADQCCAPGDGCTSGEGDSVEAAARLGYSVADVTAVEGTANMGLGCGNPTAIAGLDSGETVLDLGSGGGFDCFLAAREVGPDGRVIGVDMTPEMLDKARTNADRNDAENVEFHLGEIEYLPVGDDEIDVVISNCVINLSPAKPKVYEEAARVLRPGGRLAVSDVVLTSALPSSLRTDLDSLSGCVAGAATVDEHEQYLDDAGFEAIDITPAPDSREFIREWSEDFDLGEYLVSATIEARVPGD